MNAKRLLVVTTSDTPNYRLWSECGARYKQFRQLGAHKCKDFLQSHAFLFQVDTQNTLIVALQDHSIKAILSKSGLTLSEFNIFIASHVRLKKGDESFLKSLNLVEIEIFSHQRGNPIYDALVHLGDKNHPDGGLLVDLTSQNFETVTKAFGRKLRAGLSELKHQVARSLNSTDIQMQTLWDSWKTLNGATFDTKAWKDFIEQQNGKDLFRTVRGTQQNVMDFFAILLTQSHYRESYLLPLERLSFAIQQQDAKRVYEIIKSEDESGKLNPLHEWILRLDSFLEEVVSSAESADDPI